MDDEIKVKQLTFNRDFYPEICKIASKLAELMDRKPHDAMRVFILECGPKKIKELEKHQ